MASSGSIWVSLGLKTDKFSKGIKKSRKEAKGFGKGFKDIAKLAAGAFAVTEIVAFGKEAIELAGKMEGVKVAFDRLNDPSLLSNLRKATKGTVSDLTLMQNAVKAKNLGLPVKELGTMFEFARRRAKETGESVEFLTESIVNGIGRKSPLILDNLGISATALRDEFKKTGDFGLAAANIISREMKNMAPDIDTAAETTARLAAQLDNAKVTAGKLGVEGLQAITPFLDGLLTGVKNIDLIWKGTFKGLGDFTNDELSRTLDGGWATEAGVNISKITDAFNKIPIEKMQGNVEKLKNTWIEALGEDRQDALLLFNQYIRDRIDLEKKAVSSSQEVVKQSIELTDKQKKEAEEIRKLKEEYGGLERVQSKSAASLKLTKTTTNEITGEIARLTEQLNNLDIDSAAFTRMQQKITELQLSLDGKQLHIGIYPELKPIPEEQMEALRMQEEQMATDAAHIGGAVSGAFSSMADGMVESMNFADTASGRFTKSLASTALKLIATNMATAMSNAITGATASGSATGPAAAVTTPSFIATAIAGIIGAFASIPAFATGTTNFSGGTALVGELGPELVNLPRGSDVIPNKDLNFGGGGANLPSTIELTLKQGVVGAILKREGKTAKYTQ